jgi:hypothetical protein
MAPEKIRIIFSLSAEPGVLPIIDFSRLICHSSSRLHPALKLAACS